MGIFHVFKIVQVSPNRAKHHNCFIDSFFENVFVEFLSSIDQVEVI